MKLFLKILQVNSINIVFINLKADDVTYKIKKVSKKYLILYSSKLNFYTFCIVGNIIRVLINLTVRNEN